MKRFKNRTTKNKSTLKTDRGENEKEKDKNKSKSRNFFPTWRPWTKSAKNKNVDMKKDKQKNQDKDDVHPLTAKSVAKVENKSQIPNEVEFGGRWVSPTKSETKIQNKSQHMYPPTIHNTIVRHDVTDKTDNENKQKVKTDEDRTRSSIPNHMYPPTIPNTIVRGDVKDKTENKQKHLYPPTIPNTIVRHDVTDKTEHKQKVKAVEDRTSSLIPNGLPNLGNTCYFNATLQCLFWCKGFSNLMQNKPMGKVSDRLMEVFRYLDGDIEQENRRPKSVFCGLRRNTNTGREGLKRLLDALRQSNDQFNGYDQQDSFEMLNTILSSIQEEYKGKNIRTSFVEEEFGGSFVTTYVHDQCQEVDLVFQNFTTISIPVPETKTTVIHSFSSAVQRTNKGSTIIQVGNSNVNDVLCLSTSRSGNTGIVRGLKEVTSVETMAADILLCRKCSDNAYGSILKRSTIIAIPKILILHICRFSQSGRSLYKNQRLVSYPYILNISDVCSSAVEVFGIDSTSMQYELCGVVCHSGTMDSGHYVACVNTSPYEGQPTVRCNLKDKSKIIEENLSRKIRNSSSDHGYSHDIDSNNNTNHTWYKISDSHVQSIHSPLNLQDAYILFYRLHH